MTAGELRRVLKKVADDTEVLVGQYEIEGIQRIFADKKMKLTIKQSTVAATPGYATSQSTFALNGDPVD